MDIRVCCVLFTVLALCGCGDGRPGLVKATGKVTVNGEPVEGATVVFQMVDPPEGYGRPSTARTNASGEFNLGTYESDDGLPAGKYKVGILKKQALNKIPESANLEDPVAVKNVKYEWITPMEAADPETSGLVAEVTSSGLKPDVFALEGGGQIESGGRALNEP